MKKSVTIRKALPGETPGYYNKTAKFLDKAIPKAKTGMQVGNGLQDKLKVIMIDTYSNLRDGADPQEIFRKLLMDYGMQKEMAYQIMQSVMTKLAQDGYADPSLLEDADSEQGQSQQGNVAQNQTPAPQGQPKGPAVGTPDEDNELALSMADDDTGYDAMEHYNNRNVEQEEEQSAFAKYGGYFDDGGESEDYYDEASPEDTVINQYANPGQLSEEQSAPMTVEDMLRSFNLPGQSMKTPDLNAYLQGMYAYKNVGDDQIPNDLLPMSQAQYGGALSQYARGGGRKGKGKKGKKDKKDPAVEPVSAAPVPETEVRVEPTVRIEPQVMEGAQPSWFQNMQNAYYQKNALAPKRGVMGTATQVLGTGINYIRPQNWRESWREAVAPSTTATKTYDEVYNILRNKEYKPETLQKNEDGTYSSGLAFNMGPDLAKMLLELPGSSSAQTALRTGTPVQFEFPTSSVPELNFLSLHNEKSNTKVRLVTDKDGALKVELITDINTKLKGVDKKGLTIKDEFYIDPKNKQLIDPKTGMPLEQIQKSYFTGNELNWYNQPYTAPFTGKYPGLDLQAYPKTVSAEPLQAKPKSRWNAARNLIGLPLIATPYVLPFSYPGFAARNKFYPNASKVTVDYLGRQRELGPQAPGGMTFGDQPFGTQYADFNLQGNRNYLTGRNFMIGAGLLGAGIGGGYLYYNRDTKDWEVGSEDQPNGLPNITQPGRGFSFDPKYGRSRPAVDYKENNYGLDSMYINNGDTIHDKGWGELAPGYKTGGAHKKKFIKNIAQMFEPGGEAQDPSLGRGSRMDNLNRDVAKKKEWVPFLKRQSDKAATEELYELVQKSGDPKLMNIFMGNGQNQGMQQPMQNRPMAEGGDPCPQGTHWDPQLEECVPDEPIPLNPSREELFNDPEYRQYLDKLEYKRDVQDYKNYRNKKLIDYRKENYKGPTKQDDDGTPYPDRDSPEWDQFWNSEEFKNLRDQLPDPEFTPGWQLPYDMIPNQEHYPKIGPWNQMDQMNYDEFFRPDNEGDPENYDEKGNRIKKNEVIRKPGQLKMMMDKRYDNWCPCSKKQEIMVQGRPTIQEICVPCEQAQVGGFVNMDMNNPLTRFVYGGYDEAPDYYESEVLPEAVDGTPRCPKDYTFNTSTGKCEKNGEVVNPAMDPYNWFLDYTGPDNWPNAIATNEPGDKELAYTLDADGNKIYDPTEEAAYEKWFDAYKADTPEAEEKRFQDYQNYLNFYTGATNTSSNTSSNNKSNNNTSNTQTKCGPGTVWIEAYGQCVPMMKTNYNQRVVAGDPGLHNIFLPWNRIRKTLGYAQQRGDLLRLKDMQKYSGKSLGDPYATLSYRKNMLSPKRQLDIWNPDGKLSEADMRALMDYGVGSGWKNKGSKNKGNASNYSKSKSKEEKLSKTELIDRELKKDEWNKKNWDERIANNKSNLKNARRTFAFENPEFRRFSDKVVFKAGQPGRIIGTGENARWEQQGNYYEKTERVKEKKPKNK